MHAMLVRKTVSLLVAVTVFATAPGDTAFAAKKSAAQTCQKAINKASQKYMKTRLKKLFKCGKKAFKKNKDVTSCVTTVASKKVKLKSKKCPPDIFANPPSEDALGIATCVTRAPECRMLATTDAASMATCIECSHKFEADCLFRTVYNASTPECEMP
jgi:hypothetical protein